MTGKFTRDLRSRRTLTLELPEFLLCALEARVAEANEDVPEEEHATLDHYIETELVNLITVRDIGELDTRYRGFAEAVHQWVLELRDV